MDFPYLKEALSKLFSKSSCAMYPVVPSEAADNYRGRIVFHADRCITCGMCERVCAGGAISTVSEKLEGDEGLKYTRTFNLGSCTFCSACADFCSTKAIEFTKDYHMVATKEEDLLVVGSYIKKPVKKPAPKACATAEGEPAKTEAKAPELKPRDDGKPVCDSSKCVYCTLCAKKCPAEAITVDRAAKAWTLDEEKCVACGSCAENCPKNAILI